MKNKYPATALSRITAAALTAMLLVLSLLPVPVALASPSAQDEATPLRLGEFGRATLTPDAPLLYTVNAPADGNYIVTYSGDGDPSVITLNVTDSDGNEIYNDTFAAEVPLDLTAGDYLIGLQTSEEVELVFVVVGEIGSMSDDFAEPGTMVNGSSFSEENVDGARYATLTIEESDDLQQLVIFLQGGEDELFDISLESDTTYDTSSTDYEPFMQIFTTGGEYLLTITPRTEGSSILVIPFLSGPMPSLVSGEATTGSVTDANDSNYYSFEVTEDFAIVEVTLESAGGFNTNLYGGTEPDSSTFSGYGYDTPAVMSFVAPQAGTYYFTVNTGNEEGDDYTIVAQQLGQAQLLENGAATQGSVEEQGTAHFTLPVDDTGSFVIIAITGEDDTDIDLSVEMYDEDMSLITYDSSSLLGSNEIVAVNMDRPGTVLVNVRTLGAATDFNVYARVVGPADIGALLTGGAVSTPANEAAVTEEEPVTEEPAAEATVEPTEEPAEEATVEPTEEAAGAGGDVIEQWAIDAEASSEYGEENYGAVQVLGEPDTLDYGDLSTAWASETADGDLEVLLVAFEIPVVPTAVEIYESYSPGAIISIEAYDANIDDFVVLWSGEAAAAAEELRTFSPALAQIEFATDILRITLDSPAVLGWNEIDAVKLIGTPAE
jgi:hypothetical protein